MQPSTAGARSAADAATKIWTPCGHAFFFTPAILEQPAIRCPACDTAMSTRVLADAASAALLLQLAQDAAVSSSSLCALETAAHPWLHARPSTAAQTLHEYGLLICHGSAASADRLVEQVRREADASLASALALPAEEARTVLSEVRAPTLRHDVRLDLTHALRSLLAALVAPGTAVGDALEDAFGPHAQLCECSCIVAEPGAAAQAVHCDTWADDLEEEAVGGQQAASQAAPVRLLTAFVALQDIGPSCGPTAMWPRTHAPAFHAAMSEQGPHAFDGRPSAAMTLRAGDAALMDSRLWHCGTANTSATRRFLLVVTFGAAHALPEGSTYSLLPRLEGRWTLQALRQGRRAEACRCCR